MQNAEQKSRNIAVYCASSTQLQPKYYEAAARVGELIGRRGATLINGAGNMGLMQASADACLAVGGRAIGIIPTFMIEQDWHHRGMTEFIETRDMSERKQKIQEMSDASIILPGGCGTMDEMFELITLKQLGIHLGPIVILNLDGFYDHLLAQLEVMMTENFMRDIHRDIWRVASSADEAVELAFSTPDWDGSIRRFAKI